MNAYVKYTLGRIGLFLAVFVALLPVPMNLLLKLMIAVLASAGLALFLLRGWREEMATNLAAAAQRRKQERQRLRAALAGDDAAPASGEAASAGGDAATAGDAPAEPKRQREHRPD